MSDRIEDFDEDDDIAEGQWVKVVHDNFLMSCCGCGLVHRVDFRIVGGQVALRMFVDKEATERERQAS